MDFAAEQFSSEEISQSQHSDYIPEVHSQTSSSSSSSDSSQVNRIYVCDIGPSIVQVLYYVRDMIHSTLLQQNIWKHKNGAIGPAEKNIVVQIFNFSAQTSFAF